VTVRDFSLAVIGSGSGNTIIPADPGQGGAALIEAGPFGGTCINRGCIPSKMLAYTAEVAARVRQAPRFGVAAEVTAVDWPAIRDRVFGRTDRVSADGRDYRAGQDGVTLFRSRARFTGRRELALDRGETIRAGQIVIATGSRPVVPPVVAGSGVGFHTSDTIMRIDALPASLVILGGGYVAVELAHVFSSLGVGVRIVEAAGTLLPRLDAGVAERFTALAAQRWDLHLSANVTGVHRHADGVAVTTQDGATVTGGLLLVATGRRPNTDGMNLDLAGVGLDEDGYVAVDEFGRAADGIWALGDCIAPFQLKHVANAEARAVAHNLAHPGDLRPLPHDAVPQAVFSEPQIASVGARGQDLTHTPHVRACRAYGDTAYGWALQDTSGFCTIYADPATGLLLGAHIIGHQASLLITPLIQAMAHRQRLADLARGQYWIHPALSEVVEHTLLALDIDLTVRSGQVH
jgi:mycothione reductase